MGLWYRWEIDIAIYVKVNINFVLRYLFYVSIILSLTQSSNMIDNHRKRFNEKVLELQEKKGKNSRMLSKDHYVKTVEQLKTLENPMVSRTPSDHNLLRWGGLLRVKPGTKPV